MESRSERLASGYTATATAPCRQRKLYRHEIRSLAYVNVDTANGGIIRNLSQTGIAIQAVVPLEPNQQVHVRFELLTPRVRVETQARVAWADASGQAGIEFLPLPPRCSRLLKDWIFIQLLISAQRATWDDVFVRGDDNQAAASLQFSPPAHSPIPLSSTRGNVAEYAPNGVPLHIFGPLWSPSPGTFAIFVDGMIISCAVLLFSVISLAIIREFPAWPVLAGLISGVTLILSFVYRTVFSFCVAGSPGSRLAQLAARSSEARDSQEEDRPRFR